MLFKGLRTAGVYWVEDQAALLGAALAYYALFSFAPLLVIASTIAGQVYGTQAARTDLAAAAKDVAPTGEQRGQDEIGAEVVLGTPAALT